MVSDYRIKLLVKKFARSMYYSQAEIYKSYGNSAFDTTYTMHSAAVS
jgi:hypothetical protein